MTEHEDANAKLAASRPSSRLLRWLFYPTRQRFLLPATGVWILALDWVLFSSNVFSAWLATPVVMVAGFLFGGAGTFLAQLRGGRDTVWRAALKALLAGIVVGVPWPIGGTFVGGWVVLSSGLIDARRQIMGK